MPALVIKNLPAGLHRRLKAAAKQQRRSMAQQAIVLLEQELAKVEQRRGIRH